MSITMLNADNFDQEVRQASGTILVDFYADWCGPCKMQSPIVDALAEEMEGVKFCKLNIDDDPQLAMEFGVMSIPTIMILKDGEITYKQPGLLQKKQIVELLG